MVDFYDERLEGGLAKVEEKFKNVILHDG